MSSIINDYKALTEITSVAQEHFWAVVQFATYLAGRLFTRSIDKPKYKTNDTYVIQG